MGRSLQEPAEPLGAVAVEAPLAERRRREDGIEVGIECIDRRGRQNVRADAIAAFDQPGGQFFGRHICHSTNSCWPNSANVRSEERREGKECVRAFSARWTPYQKKTKKQKE